jgi:hypothetical protein
MPLATFVRRAYGLPVVLNGLMAAALWFIGYQVPVHTYAGVALELAGGGLVYGAGLAWALLDSGYSRAQSWDAVVRLLEPNRNA